MAEERGPIGRYSKLGVVSLLPLLHEYELCPHPDILHRTFLLSPVHSQAAHHFVMHKQVDRCYSITHDTAVGINLPREIPLPL